MEIPPGVEAELEALRADIGLAADGLLFAAEAGLSLLDRAKTGDAGALGDIGRLFTGILEACAFQDLTGQRLSKIEALLSGAQGADKSGLLHGPALHGQGLEQAGADAIFDMPAAAGGA